MKYPNFEAIKTLVEHPLPAWAELQHEYGAKGTEALVKRAEKTLSNLIKQIRQLPIDKQLAAAEPNNLEAITALRPKGPRRIWQNFDEKVYRDKLQGALLARMAGCTLGAPVEGWLVRAMENLAKELGVAFPPTDYWTRVPDPFSTRYDMSRREEYTKPKMKGVPVDDDVEYTLLGLLIAEEFGPMFTIEQVGKAWVKYLPVACTAEGIALDNLKKKVPIGKVGEVDNRYCQWIGADIRSDPWGYMAPGWPELAADMAYRDAYISHRRNGIYGEMFFSAAIAAAFCVKHPLEAIEIGLTEIPRRCLTAEGVRWALKTAPKIKDYAQARAAVDRKFPGMHPVHTINNACLTIFGLAIGGTNVTKVIGQTVAMGMDNDCTAATAGSIAGAVVGKSGVPKHWYRPFANTIHSYLIGKKKFAIDNVVDRFTKQAANVFETVRNCCDCEA